MNESEELPDLWILDRADLRHNHEPQSLQFYKQQQSKEINESQRAFISYLFMINPRINGAEVRRIYRETNSNMPDLFGKKVQNLL